MELASIAPERLNRMILVSPANPFARRYHTILRFYLSAVGRFVVRVVPFMPGRAWDYGIGRMYAHPKMMAAGTGLGYARALRPRGATRQILCSLKTFAQDVEDLRTKLTSIARIPTMIVWGDRDPVVELQSGYLLQRELGAEMAIMSDVGHMPYEESPEEFNKIVIEWLKKT
jgi:pimeloyl-ACP methyl ester carboxylesterase